MVHYARNHNLKLILQHFLIMWVLTIVGVIIGTWLPSIILMLASLICIALLIVTCIMNIFRLADIILYVIPFLMGTLFWWIAQLLIDFIEFEFEFLFTIFICTVLIFILLATIGLRLRFDISDIASLIFTVLLGLVVFFVTLLFFPVTNSLLFFLAAVFVLIVAIYTVYNFNLIRHQYVKDDEIVWLALNLYLGFINLLRSLFEMAGRLRK